MRRRNRPAHARDGIALGWVLAIILVLIIVLVVWLVRQPGPAGPGGGPAPAPEEEEAAPPEEPGAEEAQAPPAADEAEAAEDAEEAEEAAPAEEGEAEPEAAEPQPDDAEEADAEAPPDEAEDAESEEAEPEEVEAEIETPEQSEALFTEGDRQVDASSELTEASQRLTQALEDAEAGMEDLRRSEGQPADVDVTPEDGELGASAEPSAQDERGRVATPDVSLQSLRDRTRGLSQDVGDAITPAPRAAPSDAPADGAVSLSAPEPADGGQARVRSAEDVGGASQDALQRARERLGEARPVNDGGSP